MRPYSENALFAPARTRITVGLAGNPNCGKTTLFNTLTGSRQKVGNYAGVTVDKKEGLRRHKDKDICFFDLPGTYSLTAYSVDEMVARDFLLEERPDVIVNVLDATNLRRNLYLTLQFMELGLPVVGVLNISDQAEKMGLIINERELSALLGFPLIKTVGTKGIGTGELLDAVVEVYEKRGVNGRKTASSVIFPTYGPELEREIENLIPLLETDADFCAKNPSRWCAVKLLEKDIRAIQSLSQHKNAEQVKKKQNQAVDWIETHFGRDAEIVVSEQRYAFIIGALTETTTLPVSRNTVTDKIDRVVLNRFLGLPIFLGIMWGVFQLTFTLGEYPAAWLESFFSWLAGAVGTILPSDGLLRSLIIDGIIGGVGGVFSFVPLVVLLFLFISLLEDLGYMARAAFVMDKFLHIFGLHGQSFLPMMLGFGCSVPAIMAARTLKSRKDRILTVLVIPFMSCGAKLPVYVVLTAAFFPSNQGTVVMLLYAIGIAVALISASVLRRTVLRGPSTPFVMELPPYRLPTLQGIAWHIADKTLMYVKRAGTTILAASILIWFITSFPQAETTADLSQATATAQTDYDSEITGNDGTPNPTDEALPQESAQLEASIAGHIGKFIEPVIAPIGFDWKIGIAMVTGLAAKEVIVSTLGVIYKVGSDGEEEEPLRHALRADQGFNTLVAFVLMLFTLLVTPCIASLATIRAELGGKWLLFAIGFTLIVAWLTCFAVFQIGSLAGLDAVKVLS